MLPAQPELGAVIPRVAVLLAAYNGMAYIGAQLESILAQRGVAVQVFISVDLSSDGTQAWAAARAADDTRITVLPVAGRFGGAAPNFLRLLREVDISNFDFVSLADQDDLWSPEKLEVACARLTSTGASGYSSNVTAFWPSGRQMLVRKAQPQRMRDYLFEAAGPGCTYVLDREHASIVQAVVRREQALLAHLGYHDWLIYAIVRASGARWFIDPVPRMLYRQHADNQIGVNSGWRSWLRRGRQLVGGHGFAQAMIVAQAAGLSQDPFVVRSLGRGRAGMWWLARHAGQCRRRARDRWLFAALCICAAITGALRGTQR